MTRVLLAAVVLTVFAMGSQAEERVVRLTVQPMPAPKPALRYLLLPELKEMTPGNPIPNYLKCVIDKDGASPVPTVGSAALREADRAARMDKPDWQILSKVKTDGIRFRAPDVRNLRELARSLQKRFREEIALGRFDDAFVTAKTMFAMARHMTEHPTLDAHFVAMGFTMTTLGPLQEMLEQRGCPNLYWALTTLPHPFIPLDKGMNGERLWMMSELSDLDDRAAMSEEQLKKLIAYIDKLLEREAGQPANSARAWLDVRVKDEKLVSAARRRLVEVDLPKERLEQFPADQVILLDEKRSYEQRRDESMKLINLPVWQAEALAAQDKSAKEPALFDIFLTTLPMARRMQGRLEQWIAFLRHIEALRMYAADHGGKLPEKLADISVPLPVDPFSGKPFLYRVDGNTAHLRGTPPPGEEKNISFNLRYEVTIQK